MDKVQLVYNKKIIMKKPKLKERFVANRDVFFSIKSVPGDGHCLTASQHFGGKLRQKF